MTGATPPSWAWPKASFDARCREELAVRSLDAFRHGDDAVAVPRQRVRDLGEEALLIERDLGQQQDVRRVAFRVGGKRAGGGRPAGMPAHHLQHEHLGRGAAIDATSNAASRIEVATYFATEPKPGEQSVIGRSLSTVLGMPTHTIG